MPVPISEYLNNSVIESPAHTTATAKTTTAAVVAANATRSYLLVINDSDTVIYLGLGVAAVANQGIRLNANGGSYEMSAQYGNLYRGAVNSIHGGSGDKTLLVTEA